MKMEKEKLNFNPVIETRYLRQFSDELRKQQLETEISTALSELLLSEYSHDYLWDKGQIVDRNTGIRARDLAKKAKKEGTTV